MERLKFYYKSVIALCLLILLSCLKGFAQVNTCPATYFKLSLYAPGYDRYYLAFKVKHKEKELLACAPMQDVYNYFSKYNHVKNKEEFATQFSRYLYKGIPLISPVALDSLSFEFARNPTETDEVAKRGEKYFIHFFFNKHGCLREDRKVSKASVIKYLQSWCIWSFQDDETGCLVIDSKLVEVFQETD